MPLSQSEQDEGDVLLVSVTFGDPHERVSAQIALERWAGHDPERHQYIADYEASDRAINFHASDLRRRYERHIAVPQNPETLAQAPKLTMSWRHAATFGAPVLCCVLLVAAWIVDPVLSSQRFSSAVGEQVSVDLNDGSHVQLNTNTAGVFLDRLRSREVTLTRGEALFSVAHSKLRLFQVTGGPAIVRDIGTRFSMRADANEANVAVLEGRVQLSLAGRQDSVELGSNQAARASDGRIVRLAGEAGQFEALVAWKDGRFQFNGSRLSDVVRELQRYRKAPIVLADSGASGYKVTGEFSNADPNLLLKTLPAVAPVTVRFLQNGTAVIASRR